MPEHTGHRQRMRQRYREAGLEGFAPHEVLELILYYAIPQKNTNPLAHRLLERFGSLQAVLEAPVEQLAEVEGIGENAATLLSLFPRVNRRVEQSRSLEKSRLQSSAQAGEHCRRLLEGLTQEHFYLVCLNAGMELLGDALIAKGALSEVPAYPRLVADAALRMNAHTVIFTHNHPGGSCEPSPGDLQSTARLASLLASMDICPADHIIVAGNRYISLAEAGLMPGAGTPEGQ